MPARKNAFSAILLEEKGFGACRNAGAQKFLRDVTRKKVFLWNRCRRVKTLSMRCFCKTLEKLLLRQSVSLVISTQICRDLYRVIP